MESHQLPPGTYLEYNKYYIDQVLGDGGFGITYLGYDVKLQRKVAIKEFYMQDYCYRNPGDTCVYPSPGEKGRTFERLKQKFIEEGQVLAVLGEQPGVVNVYTFIEENNTAYLVMDFVEGQSLENYIRQAGGRLSVSQTLAIMRPVIRALGGVHRHHVVHRDISPDNIMITYDRKVKLIDFGAAKQYGDYNSNKVQKIGYSPIEQVTANGQVGPYSDIYALCATIYYCITGEKVLSSKERAKEDLLVLPSALGVAISPQMEAVLMQGLAVYPEQRIQDADSLYYYLYESFEQAGTQQQPAGISNLDMSKMLVDMQKEQKKNTRKRILVSVLSSIIMAFLAVFAVFLIRGRDYADKHTDSGKEDSYADTVGAEEVNCEAYAQEFYDMCEKQHEQRGISIKRRKEYDDAAVYAAKKSAALSYSNTEELNAGLSEIGNQTIETFKIPNTGWVIYTFSLKEDVATVKKELDTYIVQMNQANGGTINLDNCEDIGVGVARAEDGTYFWAVFYR